MKHAERKIRVQVHAEVYVCMCVCFHIYYISYLRQDLVSATADKKKHRKHTFVHPASLCCVTSCTGHSVSFAALRGCLWQDRGGNGGGEGQGGVGEEEGEAGVVRGEGWLLSSLLSAPSLGQAGRLCWAAQLLGSRCEPSCQRQAVARRSAARAHTSLSHLP